MANNDKSPHNEKIFIKGVSDGYEDRKKQAGAELCQAQGKLKLARL